MYQVLARKYRPRNFHELVGQSHVSRALTSALERGRLHHAYLFTGTRGVGKTTIARILAKCLNCETGITATPCEVCSTCRAVNEGRFIDLIEIDAASRTKVEDTRELLDNVPYAPTQGRFKVYLIDEVHMLSTHSFNALLKTLEEPPEHVKFLFATTDPQKLPITVISRCLQFTLRPLAIEEIQQHLSTLLVREQITANTDAIWQIAEAAQGSLRDALSLTDQAIAYGQGQIQAHDVKEMLGLLDRNMIYDLLLAIHANQQQQVSTLLLQMRQQALDVSLVLDQLIATLHELAMLQYLPELALHHSQNIQDKLQQLSKQIHAQDLQLYYQITCKGRADLAFAVTQQQGFEMCVLRLLAFQPLANNQALVTLVDSPVSAPAHLSSAQTSAVTMTPTVEKDTAPRTAVQTPVKIYQVADVASSASDSHTDTSTATVLESVSNLVLDPHFSLAAESTNLVSHIADTAVQQDNTQAMPEKIPKESAEIRADEPEGLMFDLPSSTTEIPTFNRIVNEPEWLVFPTEQTFTNDTASCEADAQQPASRFDSEAQPRLSPCIGSDAAKAINQPAPTQTSDMAETAWPLEEAMATDDRTADLFASVEAVLVDHVEVGNVEVVHQTSASNKTQTSAEIPQNRQNPILENIQPDSNVPQRDTPQQLLQVPEQDLTGQWTVQKWDYWIRTAAISPAVQELAQNARMSGHIEGVSTLTIAPQYQNMLSQLQSLLEAALQVVWPTQQLNIVYAEPNDVTPYHLQQQRKQNAYARAETLLQQHPTISAFLNHFDGALDNIQLK